MKIMIVGCGKIGYTIAKTLSAEKDVHVTVIDNNVTVSDYVAETMDVKSITGNGLNEKTLIEAGAVQADLIVSVTDADEVNILCCIVAKHLGTKHPEWNWKHPILTSREWKSHRTICCA